MTIPNVVYDIVLTTLQDVFRIYGKDGFPDVRDKFNDWANVLKVHE